MALYLARQFWLIFSIFNENYSTHNNEWSNEVVRASLILMRGSKRVPIIFVRNNITFLHRQLCSDFERRLSQQKAKHEELIFQLKFQLQDLETFACEASVARTTEQIQRHQLVLENLRKYLQLDINDIYMLTYVVYLDSIFIIWLVLYASIYVICVSWWISWFISKAMVFSSGTNID